MGNDFGSTSRGDPYHGGWILEQHEMYTVYTRGGVEDLANKVEQDFGLT
jgi:hypothetical protein